jgi:hypothetical protein
MKTTTTARIGLALLAGTLVQGLCFAESAEESVVECTRVADKNARLRCYDDHMTRLGHKIGTEAPSAVKPSAPVSAPAESSKQSEFGASPELLRKQQASGATSSQSSSELTARVRSVSELAHGELRIELDNDQVWVETQHWASPGRLAAGDTVTLKHGTLGSFFLTRNSGPALRVKRVQ